MEGWEGETDLHVQCKRTLECTYKRGSVLDERQVYRYLGLKREGWSYVSGQRRGKQQAQENPGHTHLLTSTTKNETAKTSESTPS